MKKIITIFTLALACFASAHIIQCDKPTTEESKTGLHMIEVNCVETLNNGDTAVTIRKFRQYQLDKECAIFIAPLHQSGWYLERRTLENDRYCGYLTRYDKYDMAIEYHEEGCYNIPPCRDSYNTIKALLEKEAKDGQ